VVYAKHALAELAKTLKNLWSDTVDYLKTVFGESWKDANDMFAQFDKEGYNIPAPDYSAGGTKQCPSPAAARAGIPPASSHACRCAFFWFFCKEVKFEEPDDPNQCPYKTVQQFIAHITAQPEWKSWRAAPLQERARHAREMAKRFHPDKYACCCIVIVMSWGCILDALARRELTAVQVGSVSTHV
jgi:hypothetical protein